MPLIDIIIAVAISISIIVGFLRGFVKEAISVAALVFAIWAAFNLGPQVAPLSDSWLSSESMRLWFGRILVFVVVLIVGGLLGWAFGKLVRMSVLSGMDRLLGMVFGFARGVLLGGVFVIGGQYAELDRDDWWQESRFIPYLAEVADWLRVMAPKGMEMLAPPGETPELPATAQRIVNGEG